MTADVAVAPPRAGLERRLRPIYVAAFLQNVALWVPIEKLFMTDIGFDNGSVAVMAAAYAAVVPLLEVPSGILADRWSRRGVVLLAQAALDRQRRDRWAQPQRGRVHRGCAVPRRVLRHAVGHVRVDRL